MKAASAGLIALLSGNSQFLMADLYTVTLQGGTVYRWTSAGASITVGGHTFTSTLGQGAQPLLSRGPIRQGRGLEVSTLDLTLYAGDSAQLLGVRAPLAAHNGALDNARVRVERLFMPTWGDVSEGTLVLFEGNVAGVDIGSTQVVVHVKSDLERLTVQMPRTLFQPACPNIFGDASCGVSLAGLTVSASTGSGSTARTLLGASGHADGYFQNGVVVFTSGANTGARRAVSSYLSNVLALTTPLLAVPAPGDTFTVVPGCKKTIGACAGFSNSTRFRGCPFIPSPETTR